MQAMLRNLSRWSVERQPGTVDCSWAGYIRKRCLQPGYLFLKLNGVVEKRYFDSGSGGVGSIPAFVVFQRKSSMVERHVRYSANYPFIILFPCRYA